MTNPLLWRPSGLLTSSKLFLDIQPIARVSILFAKLSILLLYLRIFFPAGTRKTTLWWLIHLTIWVNILYTVALTLATVLQCVPYGLPWGKTCINQYLVLILSSTINIISDIAVLIIPLGSIWALQMTQQVKWAVWALFAFGALAPLASIARLAYQIPNADSENKTVVYPTLLILATAEQVVAMVGGSIPIASATILRLLRGNSRSGSGQSPSYKRSTSQHIWPGREGHVRLPWRASDRHGSFALNDTLLVGSEEVLYPEEAYRSRDIELERTLSRSDASSGIR